MTKTLHDRRNIGKGEDGVRPQERSYRRLVRSHLSMTLVRVQETDLSIYADTDVAVPAREAVILQRGYIENYIRSHEGFLQALSPWPEDHLAPAVVRAMIAAGRLAGVGPMAAVAGAVAEQVGLSLLDRAAEVIIENGGDIFIHTRRPLTVAVYAGRSPLSMKVALRLEAAADPQAVCTSSGTVGHSLSFGAADAVTIVSASCPLADAAATAVGNRVKAADDIQSAIEWGRAIEGIDGILIIAGAAMGAWGKVQVVPV